jgi:hypothetical protein
MIGLAMPSKPITRNTLFYGGNRPILREHIEQLLDGAQVQIPPAHRTFKQAQKVKKDSGVQGGLDLGV